MFDISKEYAELDNNAEQTKENNMFCIRINNIPPVIWSGMFQMQYFQFCIFPGLLYPHLALPVALLRYCNKNRNVHGIFLRFQYLMVRMRIYPCTGRNRPRHFACVR